METAEEIGGLALRSILSVLLHTTSWGTSRCMLSPPRGSEEQNLSVAEADPGSVIRLRISIRAARNMHRRCLHGRRASYCREGPCQGAAYCKVHPSTLRHRCRVCSPLTWAAYVHRNRVRGVLAGGGGKRSGERSFDFLGCSPAFYRAHVEGLLREQALSWADLGGNGGYHLDHKVPLLYRHDGRTRPTRQQMLARFHWTNLQVIPAAENLRKGNRFVSGLGEEERGLLRFLERGAYQQGLK